MYSKLPSRWCNFRISERIVYVILYTYLYVYSLTGIRWFCLFAGCFNRISQILRWSIRLNKIITVHRVSDRTNADKTRGKPIRSTGTRRSGPRKCCTCFVFLGRIIICRLHNLTHLVQAQVTVQLKRIFSDAV